MLIPVTVNCLVDMTFAIGCSPLYPNFALAVLLLTLLMFLIVTVSDFCSLCGSSVVNVRAVSYTHLTLPTNREV